ncbi:ester cyclase [Necropsobacter rosorum]|uniref:ester cyclase n=1 Tax=Necropsobacter rosorum TaxID=908285 RepID=UPI000509D824
MQNLEQNKAIVAKLLAEALPNNDLDYVRQVVDKQAVTRRAGFAALYEALGSPIPKDGNFLDWMEQGWALLLAALGDQKVEMQHLVAEGNKVMAQWHYSATHQGEFVGAAATHQRIEWDEIGIFTFNDDGKIIEMWYLCEEAKAASQLGYQFIL